MRRCPSHDRGESVLERSRRAGYEPGAAQAFASRRLHCRRFSLSLSLFFFAFLAFPIYFPIGSLSVLSKSSLPPYGNIP